ncbi:MAG: hypothetical protein AMXMBFR56_72400 [Polyangiaceae bacterium]
MTTLLRREAFRREMPKAADAAAESDSRVRRFVASDESVDSYNSVIKADGWELEQFSRNPVILFGHASRELPIGKGTAWVEGKSLLLDVEFFGADANPMAEQAMRIVDQGVMGVSVGFEPLEYAYNAERETGDEWVDMFNPPLDYTRSRLLEVSVVTLPANPNALPVGRELTQKRVLERLNLVRAPKKPAEPTAEQLRELVNEVVREEVRAFRARRTGRISGG